MPKFTAKTGATVWVPFHAVLMLQEEPGGLETLVVFGGLTMAMGPQQGACQPLSTVVQGTLDGTIKAFKAEAASMQHFGADTLAALGETSH